MDAERFAVVSLMGADEARAAVVAINHHMISARAILVDLYERRGWAALGYTSWRACVTSEFAQSKSRLYQELEAAQIEQRISTNGGIGLIPERQLRPLTAVPDGEQPFVWHAAQQIADGREERFSTRHVQAAVDEYLEEKTEDMTDRPTRFNAGMRSSDSPEWFTPAKILTPVRAVLGKIDLDPCSNNAAQKDVQARRYYTEADDGLSQPWDSETLFMNPPYGRAIGLWTDRLVASCRAGTVRAALALLPGRTDTDWFTPLFDYPICFVHGRLQFSGYAQAAPFPSVVVYFGPDLARFARAFTPLGPIMLPLSDGAQRSVYNPKDIRTPGHAARTLVTA